MKAPRLFGTNGIRGVVGATITADFAYKIGSSVATIGQGKPVLVGRDGRTSSLMLSESLVAGILAQGADVKDCGQITTPALQFLVKTKRDSAGVVVTASHNPPEYNGFKMVDSDGIEISREKEERLENIVAKNSGDVIKKPGRRTYPAEPIEPYLSSLRSHMTEKIEKPLKIIVDIGNGVAALTTPVLLRRIGCEVLTINDNIDGTFPGRNSEPRPENLAPLATLVKEERATFGVAHDGDGDRAMFVDEMGTIHSGDESFSLIEDDVLRKHAWSKVVTPVNSSMSVADIARRRRGRLILTPVGSIHVARTMIKEGAILGGEENGGIFYSPHQPVRDGAMATVLILNSIVENRMRLSELMSRLPRFFMIKEKHMCPDNRKYVVIGRIRERLGTLVTSTIDGVRVDLKRRGWFLARASGTEPLVRVYFEGRTESDLKRMMEEFKPIIDRTIES